MLPCCHCSDDDDVDDDGTVVSKVDSEGSGMSYDNIKRPITQSEHMGAFDP